jgi:hypothetical protein
MLYVVFELVVKTVEAGVDINVGEVGILVGGVLLSV